MKPEEKIRELSLKVIDALSELFISGMNSVHDSTLEEIKKLSEISIQCGLKYGGEQLGKLCSDLSGSRHQMRGDYNSIIEQYCSIEQYFMLCRKKAELDEAKNNLAGGLER